MPVNFPTTTDFQDNYEPQNRWSTTLAAVIGTTDVSIQLSDTPPSAKGWVTIDSEHIYYDTVVSNTISVASGLVDDMRGQDDSTAATHSQGSIVEQRINAAAIQNIMDSVKKRKQYSMSLSQVSANSMSEQNITGFSSRAMIHDLRIAAVGGSTQFKVELYSGDSFSGMEKVYETIELESIESSIDQISSSGQENIYVTSTSGFLVDELVQIQNTDRSIIEFALIEDIDSGVSLESYNNLVNTFDTNSKAVLVHRDRKSFYYEDLDWSAELHVKVTNLDTSNSVTVYLNIIAEISDE